MGIASLVLGILAFLNSFLCFIPFFSLFYIVYLVLALVFGIIGIVKNKKRVCGIIGVTIAGVSFIIFSIMSDARGSNFSFRRSTLYENNETKNEVVVEERNVFNLGEVYENSRHAIRFTSIDEDFKDYRSYVKVKEGYKIIKAEFDFENLVSSNLYASVYDFSCYADDYKCDDFYSFDGSLNSQIIEKDKKGKLTVCFEVPENANKLVIEYREDSLTNIKFKVK